jgi:hypothetical protein
MAADKPLSLKTGIAVRPIYLFLIMLGLLLAPIFNISEVIALLGGYFSSPTVSLTPIYIKLIKDALFLLIILVGLLNFFSNGLILLSKSLLVFITAVGLSALMSYLENTSLISVIMGIRWILPFFLLLFIYRYIDEDAQKKIAGVMIFVFAIAFALQIIELFNVKYWYGLNSLGLNSRNPGFYIMPSSMAMFALLTMFYAQHFISRKFLKGLLVYFLGPISIFLSGSGTGVVALFLFYAIILYFQSRQKQLILLLAVIMTALTIFLLPVLTGREDIYLSGYMRASIFAELIGSDNFFLSDQFGSATNSAVLMKSASTQRNDNNRAMIVDSTITSIVFNVGTISLLAFIAFFLRFLRKEMVYIHFAMIYGIFMFTTIIFELFPSNLLFAVNLSYFYYLNQQKRLKTKA